MSPELKKANRKLRKAIVGVIVNAQKSLIWMSLTGGASCFFLWHHGASLLVWVWVAMLATSTLVIGANVAFWACAHQELIDIDIKLKDEES
jgi:hypothetical protein